MFNSQRWSYVWLHQDAVHGAWALLLCMHLLRLYGVLS